MTNKEKDDLIEEMWNIICNVRDGLWEYKRQDWKETFVKIRERYHVFLKGGTFEPKSVIKDFNRFKSLI